MPVTDPVADLLTRIRNGLQARKKQVDVLNTTFNRNILTVLLAEGFIEPYQVPAAEEKARLLSVKLKYGRLGEPVIRDLDRVSTPGRRVYVKVDEIPLVCNGLGIAILSTPVGVLSSREARNRRQGGELLCTVS